MDARWDDVKHEFNKEEDDKENHYRNSRNESMCTIDVNEILPITCCGWGE